MTPAIRSVEVELLRHGPRHNQLLSPLTDYLAVCGDFPCGIVRVPYEHAEALNLLDDLRYTVASPEPTDRLAVTLDGAATRLAAMLAAVPGLAGVLAGEQPDTSSLTHLRLITSAAELAQLPFELSKMPVGAGSVGDDWLALQPDRPVCVTRYVRGVGRVTRWPTSVRILFVSGDDVPFAEHLDVFERVLEPWRTDGLRQHRDAPRHWSSEHITVIERATLDEIRAAVAEQEYSHVHVLAHGAEIEGRRSVRYGLALGDQVVTGGALALALATSGRRRHLPSVVTLAACDSAGQGSVTTPGGSVGHDLHASGVALVMASQFPISQEASIPFTETFYAGQLAGEHPFVSITEVRRQLATRFADEHAWASVVVYEALPDNFDSCLDDLHYWQSRRALDTALDRLERLASSDEERIEQLDRQGTPFADDFRSPAVDEHDALVRAVVGAGGKLPATGPYEAECDGLRAAASKRMAEVAYWLAAAPDATAERRVALFERCVGDLENALELYSSTVRTLLASSGDGPRRKATVHWIVGQARLMQAILGLEVDADLGGVARAATLVDADHPDAQVRAWAASSRIEQTILELAVSGPSAEVAGVALECARHLMRTAGETSEQVVATRRQMRRFTSWWGDAGFVEMLHGFGIDRAVPWTGEHGVVATSRAVADVLTPSRRAVTVASRWAARSGDDAGTEPEPSEPSEPSEPPAPPESAGRSALPARSTTGGARTGRFEIEMLPARNGDCLWVGYGADDGHHVLIDCGARAAVDVAAERVRSVPSVELFVLTHIDADHISGSIALFEDAQVAGRFDDVWFNGWNQLRGFLSVSQGEAFSALLDSDERPFTWNGTERADDPPPPICTDGVAHPEVELPGGMRLTVLSPTRTGLQRLARHWNAALRELDPERAMLSRRPRPRPPDSPSTLDLEAMAADGPTKDSSVPNLSSIAVLAEYGGRAALFTGDAHADVLAASIRSLQSRRGLEGQRLRLDALKLSHHGSANATTRELLEAIECHHYLVSTDGSSFYHPDRQAIARVVVHGGPSPTIHFNHRTDLTEFWGDAELQRRYGYTTCFPGIGAADGLRVEL